MECLNAWILVFILLLIERTSLVQSTCNGFGGIANLTISFLEEIPDEDIKNITLAVKQAPSQISCSLSCLNRKECVTSLLMIEEGKCVMLSQFLSTEDKYGSSQMYKSTSKIIVLKLTDACSGNPCEIGTECVPNESGYKCEKFEGKSCQDIRQKFPNANLVDGEYRITNGAGVFLFKAYCDMNFDKGGWTQVAKTRGMGFNESSTFADYSTKQNFFVTSQFLSEFRKVADFKQFRFECKKTRVGRKIHIKTIRSKTAVVDYLVGKTDIKTQPAACNSFKKYDDDNSQLSQKCARWGNYLDGKWGRGKEPRLADHTMFVPAENHWVLRPSQDRYECDDPHGASNFNAADYWNVYVR